MMPESKPGIRVNTPAGDLISAGACPFHLTAFGRCNLDHAFPCHFDKDEPPPSWCPLRDGAVTISLGELVAAEKGDAR